MMDKNKKIIRGAFLNLFRGPKPPKPIITPDTLNSKQFASLQDLISEGEIEGFATPSKASLTQGTTAYNNAALKDVFLDNTQVLDSSADNNNPETSKFNFQNVVFTPRFGTSNQTHIPGIQEQGTPQNFPVGVKVVSGSPVTRSITNTAIDAFKVTITFPVLQQNTRAGNIYGASVKLEILTKYDGDADFTREIFDDIQGRSADVYQKEYRVSLDRAKITAGTAFPVEVRVNRITASDTDELLQDEFFFTSLTEIVDDKQTYPDCAYAQIRIDSEQFSNIPSRAYRIRGIKVRIPGAGASNSGTPTIDLQTGRVVYPSGYIFNGTMGAAQWCSCPSLILLDLLTTERYGFGTHIKDADLDLFSFVAASKYSNELVDDGAGGQEPRFSCNVNIQNSSEAFKLINELAGVMRCFPIWSEGSVNISQDRPTDPSYLFSLANVGEGGFSYSGSSLKQRNTVINVSYFNMDSREIDYEVVEDTAAQAKLGIIKKDIKAFACTSRGQAQRLGKAILFSQQNETEVVTFTTSIESGAIVRPGSVIAINDPVRASKRRSGRIKSATTTAITVDNVKDLDSFTGTSKKCSVILPDGSLETRDISTISSNVINVSSAFSVAPNANSIWLIESSDLESQTFRVITVEEKDGINFTITALTYIDAKYNNIEQGISLPQRSISLLNAPKIPPKNLKAVERIVVINALAVSKLTLSWKPETGVVQYLVQYRFNKANWSNEVVVRPDFEILGTEAGEYEFKVFSYNSGLKLSSTSSDLTFFSKGKSEPPSDVENLTLEPITNKFVRLRWDKAIDADVLHGGRVYVRHSNKTDGTGSFQNSVDLVTALAGNTTEAIVPNLEGEYILKFQDDNGNFSTGETSIIVDLPDLIDTQTILEQKEEDNNFNGTKINTTFANSALKLTDPAATITGTYVQDNANPVGSGVEGSTITCTINSHGLSVGERLRFNFNSGQSVSKDYVISSVPTANTFTVTSLQSKNTSGNVTVDRGKRGLYEFASVIDLGAVFSLDLKRRMQAVGFNIGTDIETIIPTGSFWDDYATDGNFDGGAADDVNCQVQVATSQAASGSFSSYNNFANGNYKGRRFKFRLILETGNIGQNINVQQAGFTALFQSRTEQNYQVGNSTSSAPQQSGTSAKTVTFASPFFVGTSDLGGLRAFMPSIGITIEDAQSGDFFTISQPTDSNAGKQFTINIKNGSSFVDRSFTFSAVGYGKGV